MILPIQAAVERIPRSLLEASSDLGATPAQTFRTLILPLALPGVVAGSIFTFSLTLGDYIIPRHHRQLDHVYRPGGLHAAGHGGQPALRRRLLTGAHPSSSPST